MAANSLSVMSPEGGLSRYLSEIRKFPMLTKDEEFMLAKRWAEHGDPEAAHRMVTSHLRLVAKIAMGYRGYGSTPTRASGWPPTPCGGSAPRSRNTSCGPGAW
jgi:RNA polymerase sigma-32 factor